MKKLVVGLVGHSGSGKSTFSELIRERYEVSRISTGDFVREEVSRRGLSPTSDNITKVSNQIREAAGGVFMRALRGKIDANLESQGAVVIDCLREMSDYDELTGKDKDRIVVIINILSSDANRYERIVKRRREALGFSEEEFRELTTFEKNLGIEELRRIADYTIRNDDSKMQFEQDSLESLSRMEKEKEITLKKKVRKE
jgi:dephospho-CoA kinase